MVTKLLKTWLLAALSLLVVPVWALPSVPPMETAAQDAGGTVWAVPLANQGSETEGRAYFWRAGTWVAQTIPDAAGFRQRAMTRGDDGSVYVFWQKWDAGQNQMMPPCLITVHRGLGSRIFARFTITFGPDANWFNVTQRSLWVGVGGDIWIADGKYNLWHIATDGIVHKFPVDPSQYFGGKVMDGFPSQPLSSFTDSMGRRWFWQVVQNLWDANARRGVLIWDGKTLADHATLPGLPDQSFSVVTPQDAHFLWVATSGNDYAHWPLLPGGLYRVDTQTLTAVPIAPPEKDAFQSIVRIFRINGDWCVLTVSQTNQWHLTLWHQQKVGWNKEPQTLADSLYGWAEMMPKAFLETPLGTWLAVNSTGLLWQPKADQPAVRVDWRRGLALGHVNALFHLPNGHIFAFGSGRSAEIAPLPHPLYPLRPEIAVGEPAVPSGLGNMVTDPRSHLWGLENLPNSRYLLDEWDGKVWHKYSVPKTMTGINGLYACDALGRIWLATQNWNPPAQPQPIEGRVVYDPARHFWTKYDTVPDALQSATTVPGMAFLTNHSFFPSPVFSGDGHVTYTDNTTLFLGDGKTWHQWKPHDIQPGNTSYNFDFNNPLRFNPSGHLEVDWSAETWDWTPDGGWQLVGPVKPTNVPPLPPGGPKDFWGTPLTDNRGSEWVSWKNDIYLIRHGLWAKQTALSGPGSPFWDGRGISDVLQDPNGRYFFQTTPGGYFEYVVWSPPASALPPALRIQITPLSADAVRLRFGVKTRGPHWFQWRLNSGVWSAPQTTDSVTLTDLPPGSHRVEAQTIDALLQASLTPSAAVFVIQPVSAMQIARWVQVLLSGSDDAREAAVAGLVKQPAEALPALQAARPSASEDGRWWLDVAIQQITEKNAETK